MDNSLPLPETMLNIATLSYLCAALAVALVILAIITVLNLIEIKKLKQRYEDFMYAETRSGVTVESLLDDCLAETRAVQREFSSLNFRTSALERQIPTCFQKIGLVRYNPFQDTGGDLSFVIALLDETNSGFVLNGIYNRSGSYTYAKEIENGLPVKHKLAEEELEALQIAIGDSRQ